jgi:hypothetical protein
MKKKGDLQRFWEKVSTISNGPDGCWEWKACRAKNGYGHFRLRGSPRPAHRVAWELANGPIPEDMMVLHECDNPPCCNPKHLRLGDNKDNMKDMVSRGRSPRSYGSKNPNSKLREEQALEIRRRYLAGGITQQSLATEYGVDQGTISLIALGRIWAEAIQAEVSIKGGGNGKVDY